MQEPAVHTPLRSVTHQQGVREKSLKQPHQSALQRTQAQEYTSLASSAHMESPKQHHKKATPQHSNHE